MANIVFWEKPGCQGNARQKALLRAAGHELDVRDLLRTPWSEETLLPFLRTLPVAEWFNRAAPDVKAGLVVPEALEAKTALALLLSNPLLIRRPLLQCGERREVGFEAAKIAAWVGLGDNAPRAGTLEGCANVKTEKCPI